MDSIALAGLKSALLGEGIPARSSAPVTLLACSDLLKRANDAFNANLSPLGHTVESFLGLPCGSGQEAAIALAALLNRMHPDMTPDTMSDRATVDHLHACVETILRDGVPGDFLEAGAWKGGLTALMQGILKAHERSDRCVWVADSFSGLPKPDAGVALTDAVWHFLLEPIDWLRIPQSRAEDTFRRHGLLDANVRFLPGWFADTLPSAPLRQLALLRVDGDWYESTRCVLEALYSRVSPGGFVEIDDYGLPLGCRRAVDEYRERHLIVEPMYWVNHQVVFWRKPLGVAD